MHNNLNGSEQQKITDSTEGGKVGLLKKIRLNQITIFDLLKFLFYAQIHPIVLITGFFRLAPKGAHYSTGIDLVSYTIYSIMAYSLILLFNYVMVFKKQIKDFLNAFWVSQRVYLIYVLYWPIYTVITGIDGNINGFLIVPSYVIMSLICIPISFVLFFRRLKKANLKDD